MKDFFKYMLATMCGIVVMSILGGILFFVLLMGIIAGSDKGVKAPEQSVMVLKMDGAVTERTEDMGPLGTILNTTGMQLMGLDDILCAIQKAKDEPNIKGIYLEGGAATYDSPATAQQIRDALKDFRKSGKWIVAYGDNVMQSSYYIFSVANELYLNETGMINFAGLGGRSMYWKGLYDKIGIKILTTRVGRYKSYVESLTRTDMSDDDREQRTAMLTAVWQKMLSDISESRGVSAGQLNQLADDSIMLFASADDYKAAKLIDRTMYPDEVQQLIRKKLGLKDDETINQLTLEQMLTLRPAKKVKQKGGEVAVYYAYGEIVDQPFSGLQSEHVIVGTETVRDLQKLAQDDDVKAVVLRVNSGGGSAVASEQIWHAVKQLKEKKPVVVSMGGVAASGGYMISCGANYIYAEPTTITGSIGIFGLMPNLSELMTNKLGITFDGVTTNRYSDFETSLVFMTENSDELKHMQTYVDRGYDRFLAIVSDGRGMPTDSVHEIAQGRVWVATDALPIKLVDELGSVNDAVKKAAQLAGLSEYYTAAYPEKTGWIDQLMNTDDATGTYLDGQLHQVLGDLYEPFTEARMNQQRNMLQARLPYGTVLR